MRQTGRSKASTKEKKGKHGLGFVLEGQINTCSTEYSGLGRKWNFCFPDKAFRNIEAYHDIKPGWTGKGVPSCLIVHIYYKRILNTRSCMQQIKYVNGSSSVVSAISVFYDEYLIRTTGNCESGNYFALIQK